MNIQFPGNDYELIGYPAGELQVRIKAKLIPALRVAASVTIDARVKDSRSLVALLLLSDAIRYMSPAMNIYLRIPYLPYARADRRFVPGDCAGLHVFGDMLRLGRWATISALDVHNLDEACSQVSSFLKNVSPLPLIVRAEADFVRHVRSDRVAFLFPDAGAQQRYRLPTCRPILSASKIRDGASGKLSGFTVPDVSAFDGVLIVDDICDGGGTFIGIGEQLRMAGYRGEMGLYVTHAMFSRGTATLTEYFKAIYTTNSFWGFPSNDPRCPTLTVYDAWELM